MDDKVTPARMAAYAARLARRVCDTAFATTPALDGAALVSLTSVRALNLLVLHGIAGQWQAEAARLRSPYFDYQAEPVQTALSALLNTLSRHIRVARPALEPLVQRAVEDALGLAFEPAATFERRFVASDAATVAPDALRADLKYVAVNKPLFEDFLDSLHGAPLDPATLRKRLALHVTSHYKEAATPDALLAELNALEPITLAELREPATSGAAPVSASAPPRPLAVPAPVVPPKAEPVKPELPKPEAVEPEAVRPEPPKVEPVTPEAARAEAPKLEPAQPEPLKPKPEPAKAEAPKPEPARPPVPEVSAPPAPRPATGGINARLAPIVPDAPAQPLHEKFRQEKTTLNDTLRHPEAPGFAEKMETAAKIESVEAAVTINQRFALINELFDGDRDELAAALATVDTFATAEQARAYLLGPQMRGAHNWTGKDDQVQKLLKLIERKFA